uniref:Uncharacterized protein n=1 Tax=Nelumbo nucifera TaxID=4432 RepID=A0A822XTD6_NELNU|nr:TPA_asm: hypothetical protein HUJ06_022171 [Nelumbo nucifera]
MVGRRRREWERETGQGRPCRCRRLCPNEEDEVNSAFWWISKEEGEEERKKERRAREREWLRGGAAVASASGFERGRGIVESMVLRRGEKKGGKGGRR